ncbi:MAG: hypothetical protein KDA78_20845, partial [Planctomycetaceae bacterium]|nr:hypothetical protein [Planctomycetaceae bacterium]
DWFVATAAIPPLYHDLLMLPSGPGADQVLERQLNVDVERDFTESLLQRAGFIHSNVSEHNRLVDRHRSRFGYYWKSYDFKSSFGRQNLSQFPLGPDFQDNQFVRKAFQHDGGEIIFSLPNGLQGYLLIDANGTRIDRGPIEVVYDSKQPLGNKEVINGISCMVCHNRGMQPFHDDIRQGNSLTGSDLRKVHALFPTNEKFNEIIDADAQRFLQALRAATSPFLTENDDIVKREPVGAIARQYTGELNLTEIAAELGISDQNRIQLLFNERAFAQFGLRIVAQDGVLKREVWHKVNAQQRYSIYQLVSEQLGAGVPVRFTQ